MTTLSSKSTTKRNYKVVVSLRSTHNQYYEEIQWLTRTRNYEDNIWDNNEGNNICSSIEQVA